MSVERSFEAWEEVQRHGQDLADRLAQGFNGLIHSHMTPPSFPWPNPPKSMLFDLEFASQSFVKKDFGIPIDKSTIFDIGDIGNTIGRVGADFSAGLNGLVQQFFRSLPIPFRAEESTVLPVRGDMILKRQKAEVGGNDMEGWVGFSDRSKDFVFVENESGSEELEDEEVSGFNLKSAGLLGRPQRGMINITSTFESRTRDLESSLVARGDLWRVEASNGSSTSGSDNSLFLLQLGPVLFVRDTTLLLPVHLSKQHLLWYGYDRKNGMHSLCPAIWSKHRRWLLMSMLCIKPLACAQGQYPGEMRYSFSCKNKWGTRITPMMQWPDKSFTLGLSQALAWKKSGLMMRPSIQISLFPTYGGSNPGLRTEVMHTVKEDLNLICGCSLAAHPSAFASISFGRSKWNGNVGKSGIVCGRAQPRPIAIDSYSSLLAICTQIDSPSPWLLVDGADMVLKDAKSRKMNSVVNGLNSSLGECSFHAENEKTKCIDSFKHESVNVSDVLNSSLGSYAEFLVNFITFLPALMIKLVGFQFKLLVTFFTFPIWFSYFVFKSLMFPLQAVGQIKGYFMSKLFRMLDQTGKTVKAKAKNSIWNLALRFGVALFWSSYVCFMLVGLLVSGFLLGGFIMRFLLVKPIQTTQTLNFDYMKLSPTAFIPLLSSPGVGDPSSTISKNDMKSSKEIGPRFIPYNHRLQLTVSLTVPESEYNRKLGIFQVRVEFLSANGKVTGKSSYPCMLRFKSQTLRFAETVINSIPLITGHRSESQVLNIKMNEFTEGLEPTTCLKVFLEQRAEFQPGAGIPEVYAASIALESELPRLKQMIWYWRRTIFVSISIMWFLAELVMILLLQSSGSMLQTLSTASSLWNPSQRSACLDIMELQTSQLSSLSQCPFHLQFGSKWVRKGRVLISGTPTYACQRPRQNPVGKKPGVYPQNVDLPPILPKKKKKPYPVPFKEIQRAARKDKKLAERGIEKPLEPPKNGLLVPELIPVAYEVLDAWKVLIKGLAQLLHVIPVYGCSECSEVHVAHSGHKIQDCKGQTSSKRHGLHAWVKGSINDILIPIESYHLYDPFGLRIKHETRFDYDRIPAVVELCIQAGVDIPEYPSRRRTNPIRMIGKKVIDRGGYVEEPKPWRSVDPSSSSIVDLDTCGACRRFPPPRPEDVQVIAQETMNAHEIVRSGVTNLMKKYTVKACGYCSEVHVGPWGHNAKLCGEFKHQWRDGKHGWQDATVGEVFPPNYVWHVQDPKGPPLRGALKRYYGKAPAVVEVCMQAGAQVPNRYKPMMRLDIIVPESEEASLVA
ncbi:hypothetical protein V6N13_085331 [Hibiscus sabdariffa]